MAPPRRQSTSKAVPSGISTPSTVFTLVPNRPLSSQPTTKLKIHPLLEVYEAAISALLATLAEDPYRPESTAEAVKRVLAYEQELDEALDEMKRHHENTLKIRSLQRENIELSRLFATNLTSLSEARTLLLSHPDSQLAPIANKIPYQEILDYASKITKYTSPDPHWDPTRPQQPGPTLSPPPTKRPLQSPIVRMGLLARLCSRVGTYVPWPSEDALRRGRLAQLAVEGLPAVEVKVEVEVDEPVGPRRNPGRRAASVEARMRKMSQGE